MNKLKIFIASLCLLSSLNIAVPAKALSDPGTLPPVLCRKVTMIKTDKNTSNKITNNINKQNLSSNIKIDKQTKINGLMSSDPGTLPPVLR